MLSTLLLSLIWTSLGLLFFYVSVTLVDLMIQDKKTKELPKVVFILILTSLVVFISNKFDDRFFIFIKENT